MNTYFQVSKEVAKLKKDPFNPPPLRIAYWPPVLRDMTNLYRDKNENCFLYEPGYSSVQCTYILNFMNEEQRNKHVWTPSQSGLYSPMVFLKMFSCLIPTVATEELAEGVLFLSADVSQTVWLDKGRLYTD